MAFLPSSQPLPQELLGDKFTIDTPEQTSLEFTLAGIGSRFLALAIDTLIQIAAALLVGIAAAFLISEIGRTFVWHLGLPRLSCFFFFWRTTAISRFSGSSGTNELQESAWIRLHA